MKGSFSHFVPLSECEFMSIDDSDGVGARDNSGRENNFKDPALMRVGWDGLPFVMIVKRNVCSWEVATSLNFPTVNSAYQASDKNLYRYMYYQTLPLFIGSEVFPTLIFEAPFSNNAQTQATQYVIPHFQSTFTLSISPIFFPCNGVEMEGIPELEYGFYFVEHCPPPVSNWYTNYFICSVTVLRFKR